MTLFKSIRFRSNLAYKLTVFSSSTFALYACSSTPHSESDVEFNSAKAGVSSFEQDLTGARQDQVDVLSPKNFNLAEENLKDAQKQISNNSDTKDVLKPLEVGRTSLVQAKAVAEHYRPVVSELLNARMDARNADAPRLTPDLWGKAEDQFKDRMRDIERDSNGNVSSKERQEVQNRYITAQTIALKTQYLSEMKTQVKKIESNHGDQLVPNALIETKNMISNAEGTIDANRNDSDSIKRATLAAQTSYDHTKALFDRAQNVKTGSTEDVASNLLKKDVRNQSLNQELNQTNQSLTQTRTEKSKLMNEADTQAYISSLQNRFDPNEAVVYQQGNSVLIRLKGMAFSSGKTDIPAKSTALLETVKQTLKEFPNSDVLVEGHTDAIGSAAKNIALSQKRAESIKSYLEADQALQGKHIYAKGYGFNQPLSTNKTADGRSHNRRVDILIENISDSSPASGSNLNNSRE